MMGVPSLRFVIGIPILLLVAFAAAVILRSWQAAEQWFVFERTDPAPPADWLNLRHVSFRAEDGVTLHGWFIPPRNGATVVLAHGFAQGRGGLLTEARFLVDEGFGVLLYDSRGHGKSGGSLTLGYKEQLDLAAAIDFARAQSEVDPERVGAIGFSMGAVALSYCAAADPSLEAIVLLSPYPSLAKILGVAFGSRGSLAAFGATLAPRRRGIDLSAVRAEEMLPRLAPRKVLTIVGAEENGQHLMDEIEALLPEGSEMWRVPGAGHGGFIEHAPDRYPRVVIEYLKAILLKPSVAALTDQPAGDEAEEASSSHEVKEGQSADSSDSPSPTDPATVQTKEPSP